MRFLLCFAVVLLHSLPRSDVGHPSVVIAIVASLCRAAVPFFFVASGYFVNVPERFSARSVLKPLRRILPVYVIWMLIYALAAMPGSGSGPHFSARSLLTGGGAFHLWFLPVLAFCMVLMPMAIVAIGERATGALCLALAGANIAFAAYRGILHLPEVGGTRMMMAPLLFFFGMMLARHGHKIGLRAAVLAVACAWLATLGEESLIAAIEHKPLLSHGNVTATFALGVAIFLVARALPGGRVTDLLARLGGISLGIYASHLLFVHLLAPVIGQDTLPQDLALASVAFLAAIMLCLVLAQLRWTRPLVR